MAVKGDGLAKLYDTLSLDELFRLRLTAMARIWLMLAQQATEEGNRAGGLANTPRHLLH